MHPQSAPPRSGRSRRTRTLALLVVPLVATPFLMGVASPDVVPSAAAAADDSKLVEPTNAPPAQARLELDEPVTVTLITGDEVTVHPGGIIETEPGPGREHIVFDEQNLGEQISVVPSDAARLLAEGKLDERLFDITYLVREGYDDAHRGDLPLIVQGKPEPVRDVAAGPGARVERKSPRLRMSTVAQDKTKDKGQLWTRIADQKDTPASLPAGVDKVWLDGTAHVTLDESVPQIGAPEVWDAGYTGEGVTVAVLDTGVDSTHPDLAGQVIDEQVFAESPTSGLFGVEQLEDSVPYRWLNFTDWVPKEGTSDPLVHVGRACVETEGDELLADPAGRTALIARDQEACSFAEKYDAVVDAGATGVVIYNDEPGPFTGTAEGAANAWTVWGALISDTDGVALVDLLDAGQEVILELTNLPLEGDPYGHGTHVASTIAGTGAASDGARKGVAPDAQLISGRVCDENGSCQESWILAGMEWAASSGADVVNMSLSGGPTDGTDPMSQALNALTESHDVLFAVSAGNAGDIGVGTPGTADAALTVGAVDKNDELAWFSSQGPRRDDHAVKPNITAPGVGIVAARAAHTSLGTPVDDGYTSADGTSMAAPHVAGAAALLTQALPNLNAAELKDALASTATDGGTQWFEQGTGRIDVARAVDQRVYADASVDFGNLEHSAGPVERTVTYTNHTQRVVTLQLHASIADTLERPVDVTTLSRNRITVRPGDQASVTVTIDPQALDRPGAYGGVITATGTGISLRTAVGFGVQCDVVPLPDDWDEDWTTIYDFDGPTAGTALKGAALSPDGKQIFLYGAKEFGVDPQMIVMAVDADTGEEIWTVRKPVPYVSVIGEPGIAIAADGSKIFVTQNVYNPDISRLDVITIAYNNTPPQQPSDPQLGHQLWQATYEGISPHRNAFPGAIVRISLTPDGQSVILVGSKKETPEGEVCQEQQSCRGSSMLTIAYDAETGEEDWTARHKGPTDGIDAAGDVTFSPGSELAYVSGMVHVGPPGEAVGITIAYEISGPSKGEVRWLARSAGNGPYPHSTLSADGERLLITGIEQVNDSPADFRMTTKALEPATGRLLWTSTFGAADHGFLPGHTEPRGEFRGGIASSPNDDLVFVTGRHCEGGNCTGAFAIVTVAYDQTTGEERWHKIHETTGPPTSSGPSGITATTSPDGSQLYVAGTCCIDPDRSGHSEQTTLAYDSTTGQLLVTARHQSEAIKRNTGLQILVSPDGSTIYNAGEVGRDSWGISAYSPPITLVADTRRDRGRWYIDLNWSGTTADRIDIYRDADRIATTDNTGNYSDDLGHNRPGQSFTYQICTANTQNCSKEIAVTISPQQHRLNPAQSR